MSNNFEGNIISEAEGMLELDYSDIRLEMLNAEIEALNISPAEEAMPVLLLNAIEELEEEVDQSGHSKTCHSRSFGKAGPLGFGKSYSKSCKA